MSDLTREKLAELRRRAESATPFVRPGGTDPATVSVLASDALALLDAATKLAHMTEARDNARAEVDRLTALVDTAKIRAAALHHEADDVENPMAVSALRYASKVMRAALDGEADQ